VKLRGVGFVKEVGFKPGVKEREIVIDAQSGESEEEEVMGEGIGGEGGAGAVLLLRPMKVYTCSGGGTRPTPQFYTFLAGRVRRTSVHASPISHLSPTAATARRTTPSRRGRRSINH